MISSEFTPQRKRSKCIPEKSKKSKLKNLKKISE